MAKPQSFHICHLPFHIRPPFFSGLLKDLRAAAGAKALASDHDERGHDHKERNGRVVNGVSGGGQSERNSGPERQGETATPIGSG